MQYALLVPSRRCELIEVQGQVFRLKQDYVQSNDKAAELLT
jgi:hypothetical protein